MIQPRLERIDKGEVLRYLGYRGGKVPHEVAQSMDSCAGEIFAAARPRLTYRMFPVQEGQMVGSGVELTGEDIRRHLEGCREAVLMAATLGAEVEMLLMRTQVTDMARALILDSVASSAIENVCDNLEADLRREYQGRELFLTDRYSPGYGDLPIALQGAVCEALDTRRRMGLAVSGSGILVPRKSVTAILGVADTPRKRRSDRCANCSMFERCRGSAPDPGRALPCTRRDSAPDPGRALPCTRRGSAPDPARGLRPLDPHAPDGQRGKAGRT